MKSSPCTALFLVLLLILPVVVPARSHLRQKHHGHRSHMARPEAGSPDSTLVKPDFHQDTRRGKLKRPDTVQIAGSSLPDCSHACGSCSPCRLAIVSFVCASLEEAETCPMAYKCMCNSKSYPVP